MFDKKAGPRPGRIRTCCILAAAGLPIPLSAASALAPAGDGVADAAQVEQAGKLTVVLGQSQVVRPPFPSHRVSVTDPSVADVEVLTPDQILVLGKKPGTTDLVVWSQDEQVWRTRVEVKIDLPGLKADLAATFPDAELSVSQLQNLVVVSGLLRRAADVDQLKEFLDKTEMPYLNRTSLAGVQQVQIRVRVAEVSRQALRTLGFNAYLATSSAVGGIGIGPSIGGPLQPVAITPQNISAPPGGVSPAITVFGGLWRGEVQAFVQALAENQYLRVLAEPTLNCASGEEANFLAGGEFPIPVVQGTTTGGDTSISIEYKPFGVNLHFRPVVLGDNTIRLHVAPEVSDLSEVGAVVIQGFRIPSLQTRRAETTLELKSGQTFALAGLINRKVDARNSRVPGFGDLPILGALFRSVRYNEGDTELLIMVTADLVSPLNVTGAQPMPGDLHNVPNDWELFATGRLEGAAAPKLSPADAKWLQQQGLDRLRGPGAWAPYEAPPARSTAEARPSVSQPSQPAAVVAQPAAAPVPPPPKAVETRTLEMKPVDPPKPAPAPAPATMVVAPKAASPAPTPPREAPAPAPAAAESKPAPQVKPAETLEIVPLPPPAPAATAPAPRPAAPAPVRAAETPAPSRPVAPAPSAEPAPTKTAGETLAPSAPAPAVRRSATRDEVFKPSPGAAAAPPASRTPAPSVTPAPAAATRPTAAPAPRTASRREPQPFSPSAARGAAAPAPVTPAPSPAASAPAAAPEVRPGESSVRTAPARIPSRREPEPFRPGARTSPAPAPAVPAAAPAPTPAVTEAKPAAPAASQPFPDQARGEAPARRPSTSRDQPFRPGAMPAPRPATITAPPPRPQPAAAPAPPARPLTEPAPRPTPARGSETFVPGDRTPAPPPAATPAAPASPAGATPPASVPPRKPSTKRDETFKPERK